MHDFVSADITLLGNFNPYLISPEWVAKQNIWKPNTFHLALGALRKDGVQFRGEDVEWYVSSDRLSISSTKSDCGEMAAQVLLKLPHTPMSAVGANFVFHEASTTKAYPVFEEIRSAIPERLKPQLFRWGAVLHETGVRVDLTFVSGTEGTTISLNHHRKADSTEKAIDACRMFSKDRRHSDSIIDQIVDRKGN